MNVVRAAAPVKYKITMFFFYDCLDTCDCLWYNTYYKS